MYLIGVSLGACKLLIGIKYEIHSLYLIGHSLGAYKLLIGTKYEIHSLCLIEHLLAVLPDVVGQIQYSNIINCNVVDAAPAAPDDTSGELNVNVVIIWMLKQYLVIKYHIQ
eukprot:352875_1